MFFLQVVHTHHYDSPQLPVSNHVLSYIEYDVSSVSGHHCLGNARTFYVALLVFNEAQ